MADESMVLLNNQNHALPLSTSTPSIVVVGPLADDPSDQLGPDVPIGYSSTDLTSVVPVLDGIKAAAPGAKVTHAQGCDAYCTSTSGFGTAVAAADAPAVTVVVVGEPAAYSREASSRGDIDLPRAADRARPGDRRDRQALRGRADERPPPAIGPMTACRGLDAPS